MHSYIYGPIFSCDGCIVLRGWRTLLACFCLLLCLFLDSIYLDNVLLPFLA